MNSQPESAPLPKPAPEGVGPNAKANGLRNRFQGQLSENWRNSDPRFWMWMPNHRYRFRAHELRAMENLVSEEETDQLLGAYQMSRSKMRAANSLRLPYALADRLIREDHQMEFPADPPSTKLSDVATTIRDRVLWELRRRSRPGQSEKLSSADLKKLYETATMVVRDEAELRDDSDTQYEGALVSPD